MIHIIFNNNNQCWFDEIRDFDNAKEAVLAYTFDCLFRCRENKIKSKTTNELLNKMRTLFIWIVMNHKEITLKKTIILMNKFLSHSDRITSIIFYDESDDFIYAQEYRINDIENDCIYSPHDESWTDEDEELKTSFYNDWSWRDICKNRLFKHTEWKTSNKKDMFDIDDRICIHEYDCTGDKLEAAWEDE